MHRPHEDRSADPRAISPDSVRSSPEDTDPAATPGTAANAPAAPQFGPPAVPEELGRLGKYRIQRELGRGGMGTVYLAFDERLRRQIALKVMLPKSAADVTSKDRFLREARAAACISSDHVVNIYEADEIDGTAYIALQYLHGYPLDAYLRKKGCPPLPQVIRIGREVALGLAAAHKLGLVHRDIKPGNIWLEAPNGRVKLLDFGLAKPLEAATPTELTASGALVGTPAYMAPEQGRALALDGRADLFSLGCVLYLLCTGKLPFERPTLMSVLIAVASEEPTPVRELNPDVSEPFADLICRLMAKNAADRPTSASAVVKELESLLEFAKKSANATKPGAADTVNPQVIFLPIAVSVHEHDPFADIDTVVESASPESLASAPPRPPRKFPGNLAGSLLFAALIALVAAGIVIKITNKDGSVTEIKVPEGAKIEVDGKTIVPTPKFVTPVSKNVTDPDRRAAEYVVSLGGTAQVSGQDQEIKVAADLPKEAFQLLWADLMQNPKVSDEGLVCFKDCKNLSGLNLNDTKVSDAGLAHFKDCNSLTSIGLGSTKVSNDGLAWFKGCKNLTLLSLDRTQVGDAGVAHFKDCKKLSELYLWSTKVSDLGLVHFKDCEDLTKLSLDSTLAGDAGMVHFAICKKLTHVYLGNTQVGDAGLAHFGDCRSLKFLGARKTKMSAAKFEELKKAFPKCKIESDYGIHEPK